MVASLFFSRLISFHVAATVSNDVHVRVRENRKLLCFLLDIEVFDMVFRDGDYEVRLAVNEHTMT